MLVQGDLDHLGILLKHHISLPIDIMVFGSMVRR